MSVFLYWIPNVTSISVEQLRAHGLGYAFDDFRTPRGVDSGPDGMKGVVVCNGDNRDGGLGYWPGRQTWRKIPGKDAWCGCYTDDKPRPDDLARKHQVTGRWLRLDDGHKWLVPMARRWLELDDQLLWDYNLPRRLSLNETGEWALGDVKPQYEQLWKLAMAYEEAYQDAVANSDGDGTVRFRFDDIDKLGVGALQVNYRVSAVELDLLGVYDDAIRQQIIDVLMDNDTWLNWVKKKAAAAVQSGENF